MYRDSRSNNELTLPPYNYYIICRMNQHYRYDCVCCCCCYRQNTNHHHHCHSHSSQFCIYPELSLSLFSVRFSLPRFIFVCIFRSVTCYFLCSGWLCGNLLAKAVAKKIRNGADVSANREFTTHISVLSLINKLSFDLMTSATWKNQSNHILA